MWATSMIDTDSPNFKEGKEKGYYVSLGTPVSNHLSSLRKVGK